MKRLTDLLVALSLIVLVATACSENPASNDTAPPPSDTTTLDTTDSVGVRTPGAGSRFVYAVDEFDAEGSRIPGSGTTEYIETIVDTNTTFGGQAGLVSVQTNFSTQHYLLFEDNGNIVRYDDLMTPGDANPVLWLPFGSKQNFNLFEVDTTKPGLRIEVTQTARYLGIEQITVGSEQLDAHRVEFLWKHVSTFTPPGAPDPTTTTETTTAGSFWYSPQLAWFVKYSTRHPETPDEDYAEITLTAYTKK